MRFIKQVLVPGEKVLFFTRVSRSIFIIPSAIALLLIFPFAVTALIDSTGIFSWICGCFTGLNLLLLAVYLFKLLSMRASSEYVITTQRIIARTFENRARVNSIRLTQIEGFDLDQSVIGKIMNYGNVIVNGAGSTEQRIIAISDPVKFIKRLNYYIEKRKKYDAARQ